MVVAASDNGDNATPVMREPELVDPPDCACKGMPQMREHTRYACSTLKTAEANALLAALEEDRPLSPDELAMLEQAAAEMRERSDSDGLG